MGQKDDLRESIPSTSPERTYDLGEPERPVEIAPPQPKQPPPDPNEPVYQAHHDNAMRDLADAYKASDANEILQAVYSKKMRVLRAGTEGAKRDTRAAILEQVAMGEIKDYQIRMRRELSELADRIFKLEAWIDMKLKEHVSEVENVVTYNFEISLCQSQLDAMRQYHSILSSRVMRDERYMSHRVSEMATHAEENLKQQQANAGGVN